MTSSGVAVVSLSCVWCACRGLGSSCRCSFVTSASRMEVCYRRCPMMSVFSGTYVSASKELFGIVGRNRLGTRAGEFSPSVDVEGCEIVF